MYFIGYHGTSEVAAQSILSEGVQEKYLPQIGQIGPGFYVAMNNGTLPMWGATQATAPAQKQLSIITRLISFITGEANNPFIDKYARRTILKIYASRPLKHCKWNKMNPEDFIVLKKAYFDNNGPGLNLVEDCQWLQLVVPPEELQYLTAKRDDGVLEHPHNWLAKESPF